MKKKFALLLFLSALNCRLTWALDHPPPSMPASGLASQHRLSLVLKPQVYLNTTQVLLGDIADIQSDDHALSERAKNIPLGRTPKAGQTVILQANTLQKWAAKQLGLKPLNIQLQGPISTQISTAPTTPDIQAPQSPQQERKAVTQGEHATLTLQQGSVRIESRVEVLQDGHIGQKILVKPITAQDSVLARVVAVGQLEVEP